MRRNKKKEDLKKIRSITRYNTELYRKEKEEKKRSTHKKL